MKRTRALPNSGPTISWGEGTRTFSAPADLLPEATHWGAPFDLVALDWDDDGDLDLYVCSDGPSDESNQALCNDGDVFFECDALASNDPGYGASSPPTVHIGLGEAEQVDRVPLHLPDGMVSMLEGPLSPRRQLKYSP